MKGSLASCLIVALWLGAAPAADASVWHVDGRATPGGDGSSWSTAFDSLDPALAAAQTGDQVWVAAGRYRPGTPQVSGDPRSASFLVTAYVELYGGFAGHETSLAARAGLFEQTVLDGDLGLPGEASDNAYNVVTCQNDVFVFPTMRIDGFRITGGNADGGRKGGGLTIQPTTVGAMTFPIVSLYHCLLDSNRADRGGAIAVQNFGKLRMFDCELAGNRAAINGGALLSISGPVYSYATTWRDNRAGQAGGAIYVLASAQYSMEFVNDLYFDNRARAGGAAYIAAADLKVGYGTFQGCTAAWNTADVGGAFQADPNARLNVWNSIVWGNQASLGPQIHAHGPYKSIEFCDVQGGFSGIAILDVDPQFVDPLARDLRTLPGSPVHDAGSNARISNDHLDLDGDGITAEPTPYDFAGGRRVTDDPLAPDSGLGSPPVDLGAYEG